MNETEAAGVGTDVNPGSIGDTVTNAWTEVLGSAPGGPETNFFDFGGHSIAAIRMITRLRGKWDAEVPIRLIFEHPVLADFIAAAQRFLATSGPREPA
ncbi:phosphopantetheine-binding protein [Amycolatopsis sp. NPDC059021]|uniref:phosphopantetheine-binding protein n=1 Tax=Amycolatopsis sp. NPDC059021 TaxID=3346704 RepID=UPI00366D369C